MSFFDLSHISNLPASMGPPVGLGEMFSQSIRQQFRVDSARALDAELSNRWAESLRQLNDAGVGRFESPIDPNTYRAFAEHTQGRPITALMSVTTEGEGRGARIVPGDPTQNEYFQMVLRANEAIKQLNNPEIRNFEQILEEVAEMQRGVEEDTSSMSERAGWFANIVGGFGGAAVGSFTLRDPLNIATLPLGPGGALGSGGRAIAMRIAAEMAIGGAVTAATEYGDVQPAREIAGLPERNPLFNILAATAGAGVIRGGLEGIGAGVRATPGFQQRAALRELENMQFREADTRLAALLETLPQSPSARAALQGLDDTAFIERNNPYGEGRVAQERFLAELRDVQRVMGGEPQTAIARVLPPLPFEFIEKEVDFVLVRDQSPEVYARMEAAQTRLRALQDEIAEAERAIDNTSAQLERATQDEVPAVRTSDESFADTAQLMTRYETEALPNESREDFVVRKTREETAVRFEGDVDEDAARLAAVRSAEQGTTIDLHEFRSNGNERHLLYRSPVTKEQSDIFLRFEEDGTTHIEVNPNDVEGANKLGVSEIRRVQAAIEKMYPQITKFTGERISGAGVGRTQTVAVKSQTLAQLRQMYRDANKAYQDAYRQVEAEAARLRTKQAKIEGEQQDQAVNIFSQATAGRTFNWSSLEHDHVSRLVDEINAFNETLDEKAIARFTRETVGEGEEAIEREVWRTDDGLIDIGLKDPVDPEFRFSTDDGDMSIEAAMRDLQDDADLDEAMKVCKI